MSVKVDNIHFKYADMPILKGVSFEADSGLVTGIIGPNGSGKSTLLKIIGSILKPSSGDVVIAGQNVKDINRKEMAKIVTGVTQDDFLYFSYTVSETVCMGRYPYLPFFGRESKQDVDIVEEAMKEMSVYHLKDRNITQLSSGEAQRALIARALAQKPRVLTLDEPTSHLDIGYQHELCELSKRLAKEHDIVIIIVLHDLNTASRFCDKLILMSEGEIVSSGSPWNVLTEENINSAYNVNTVVNVSPVGDFPAIYVT